MPRWLKVLGCHAATIAKNATKVNYNYIGKIST